MIILLYGRTKKSIRWLKSHFCPHLDNFLFFTHDFWTVCPVDGISICALWFRKTTYSCSVTTCPCIKLAPCFPYVNLATSVQQLHTLRIQSSDDEWGIQTISWTY